MSYNLLFTHQACQDLDDLKHHKHTDKQLKAVRKALGLLELNPRHPGLHTHKFHSLHGSKGEDIFEAYAENNTAAAYRISWHYGPEKNDITIIAITVHP